MALQAAPDAAVVLSNETFDKFVQELGESAQVVSALVELFRSHPKIAER